MRQAIVNWGHGLINRLFNAWSREAVRQSQRRTRLTLLSLAIRLWTKRESISAHFFAGAFFGLLTAAPSQSGMVAWLSASSYGILWEALCAWLSSGSWAPSRLDVAPWSAGGAVAGLVIGAVCRACG